MSIKVKTRYHRPLPRGGVEASGRPSNQKVEVVGSIAVSTYSAGGETLRPKDVGLSRIDWIDIKHENMAAGKEGREAREVRYNYGTQDFYITVSDNPENAGSHTLYFKAFGDTARPGDLS